MGPFCGPLIPLFWTEVLFVDPLIPLLTSGDDFYGFQSQSGQP